MIRAGIITVSDRSYRGERKDLSGPAIKESLPAEKFQVVRESLVSDEKPLIKAVLIEMCDDLKLDLVLTTGGTGFSSRDVTPEATMEVLEKETPGFTTMMLVQGYSKTPHAILSRAVAGIRKQTLIINLPGSPKAVRESLEVILPAIPHAVETIQGRGDLGHR